MSSITWIEDDHDKISSLVKLIQNDGHKITPYSSWQEVQDNISKIKDSDVIILDIILPLINNDPYVGVHILWELRKQHNYQKPVIVCSGVRNPAIHDELTKLGVEAILTKPVRPTELYKVVTKALEQHIQNTPEETGQA